MTNSGRKQQPRPIGGGRSRFAPIAAVEYLEAARPLARNNQPGVTVTKLYLSNWPASGINLPQDDGCAPLSAPRRPALASITAPTDLNGCRLRIEVGLEHSYQLWRGPNERAKKVRASAPWTPARS